VLDCSKIAGVTGRPLRPWQDALAAYLREIGEISP
jgi:dTDP-4-dehydrorhamnose reductase